MGPWGAGARPGVGGSLACAEGNHNASALGFPTASSVPGVISPAHDLPEKPWASEH